FKSQPEHSGFVYVVRSVDGGRTFGDTIRVSDNNWSRFPEVAVMPGGNPVVTFMEFDEDFAEPRYAVTASTDGGRSFGQTVNASKNAPGEACDCCPGFIMADNQRITVLFRNNDDDLRDIWATISTDGGKTFSLSADIDKNNWMIGGCPSTGPEAITIGDSLVSVWMSGASGNSLINVGTSDLNKLGVGVNGALTPKFTNGNQNYPKIAGNEKAIGVVWQQVENSSRNIQFSWTTNGPEKLIQSSLVQLNINALGVQQNPDIAFDGTYFHVVWQDLTAKKVMYRRGNVNLTSGIADQPIVNDFQISPNPVHGSKAYLSIENGNGFIQTNLYNSNGQYITQLNMDTRPNQIVLDMPVGLSGLYFIEIISLEKTYYKKVLIMN
ncbi:MAG: hypothetical protein ACI9JN_002434, partial [Bacteroidia bacterium]